MPTVLNTIPLPTAQPSFTSGEVGVKVIDTILVVEHAVRRCGKSASIITAEILEAASNNLHFILSSLSNRGVNLWAVDQQLLPLVRGQAVYTLPAGTEKLLKVMYRRNDELAVLSKVVSGDRAITLMFPATSEIHTAGFKLAEDFKGAFIAEYTRDGTKWETHRLFDETDLEKGWHWYSFDPTMNVRGFRFRVTGDVEMNVEDFVMCGPSSDRTISRMNRDMYTDIPNKTQTGVPNSFFFDKQIDARIALWPTPQTEYDQVIIWRQRRIEDVGSLAHKLEIPERWFEAIIWALAKNMSFELEGIPPERIQLCKEEAAVSLANAELGESDGAPMYIQPNISGYTA